MKTFYSAANWVLPFTNDPSAGRTNDSTNKREIWRLVRVGFFFFLLNPYRVVAFNFRPAELFNWTLIARSLH